VPGKTTDGYEYELDITIYPTVYRGSDTAVTSSAWAQVGGRGSIPCLDQSAIYFAFSKDMGVIKSETAGVVFGTVSAKFLTTGFSPKDFSWIVSANNDGLVNGAHLAGLGIHYSNGDKCAAMGPGAPFALVNPNFGGASAWGPTPFVIAYDNAFSPAHPDGDPSVITPIRIGAMSGGNDLIDSSGQAVPGFQPHLPQP